MELSWFRDARRQARKDLKEKGLLTYTDWCRLLNLQHHNKTVSTEELNLFLVLTEVACAEHVKAHWVHFSGPGFAALLSCIFEMAKENIGKDTKDHTYIKAFTYALYQLWEEDCNELDADDLKDELLMLANPMIKPKIQKHVVGSVSALEAALGAIIYGKIEIDEICRDSNIEDPDARPAAYWAHEAMAWHSFYDKPMNPVQRQASIDYWTWYIDVAFVQAVHDANKLLSESQS